MYLSFEATQAIQRDRQRRFEAEAAAPSAPSVLGAATSCGAVRPVRAGAVAPAPAPLDRARPDTPDTTEGAAMSAITAVPSTDPRSSHGCSPPSPSWWPRSPSC